MGWRDRRTHARRLDTTVKRPANPNATEDRDVASGKYALEPTVRALLLDLGLSPTAVLRRAGLRTDLLSRGHVWLTQDEYFNLWRAVETEAANPDFVLALTEALSPELFAAPVFAALVSPDLTTAATRVAAYKKLMGPVRIELAADDAAMTIRYHWPVDANPPSTLLLAEVLFWVAMARAGTRQRVIPRRVTVPQAPVNPKAYRAYIGVPVETAPAPSVTFAAADAHRRFVTANDAMWQTFEPELRRRLRDLDLDSTCEERVRGTLLELLPQGRTTMAAVASELAMSTRTLHRRLQDEGTSFQRVLDSTREDLARHYLRDRAMSAPEIAFLLGYEEPSSFYRAFHAWTGNTPDHVRAASV
jgi:AraC-like DNA-binding protein